MMGVSLQSYFADGNSLFQKIDEISNKKIGKVGLDIYICSPDNEALEKRKVWTEQFKEKLKNRKIKKTSKGVELFNSTMEAKEKVKETIQKIEDMKKNERNINLYTYTRAIPFATIIFVNNKIYYTPNMFKHENWGIRFTGKYKKFSETNLSFCISRTSSFGEKLENMFKTVYNDINMA